MIILRWAIETVQRGPDGGDEVAFDFGELRVDVLLSATLSSSMRRTNRDIEDGVNISDHAEPELETWVLECAISDSPNNTDVSGTYMSDITLGGGGTAAVILIENQTRLRSSEALDQLRELVRRAVEVDIEGLRFDVEGWTINSITVADEVERAGGLFWTMEIQEVSKASTEEVDAPSPRVERGRRNSQQGQQPTTDTQTSGSVSSSAQNRSAAAALLDGAGSYYRQFQGGGTGS